MRSLFAKSSLFAVRYFPKQDKITFLMCFSRFFTLPLTKERRMNRKRTRASDYMPVEIVVPERKKRKFKLE